MSISEQTRKVLWGRPAALCAICRRKLVMEGTATDSECVVGDECHIVARQRDGPRGDQPWIGDIDSYDNLILLCRVHHKTVDDQPNHYHIEYLRLVKRAHELWVEVTLGTNNIENTPNAIAAGPVQSQDSRIHEPKTETEVTIPVSEKPPFTGFPDLDYMTSGLLPGDLGVVAGRAMIGKTTFLINVVRNALASDTRLLYVSLKQTETEVISRLISAEAGISTHRLRQGQMREEDWQRVGPAAGRIADAPISIWDAPDLTLASLAEESKRQVQTAGLNAVIVDDLLFLASTDRYDPPDEKSMRDACFFLKRLARTLHIAILITTDCLTSAERRQDRPRLHDLGGLEHSADIVFGLYRDSFYYPSENGVELLEVTVAKNSHGPVGSVDLYYEDGRLSTFDGKRRVPRGREQQVLDRTATRSTRKRHSAYPPKGHA